jgi:hypothetical protein
MTDLHHFSFFGSKFIPPLVTLEQIHPPVSNISYYGLTMQMIFRYLLTRVKIDASLVLIELKYLHR